eukprot:8459553-Ditylum_brightwellii.AAC.1
MKLSNTITAALIFFAQVTFAKEVVGNFNVPEEDASFGIAEEEKEVESFICCVFDACITSLFEDKDCHDFEGGYRCVFDASKGPKADPTYGAYYHNCNGDVGDACCYGDMYGKGEGVCYGFNDPCVAPIARGPEVDSVIELINSPDGDDAEHYKCYRCDLDVVEKNLR